MQRTGPVQLKQPLVIGRRIAFVTCERICRIDCIHMIHITISGRLCQNGGGADGRLGDVAVDDGTRRHALAQTCRYSAADCRRRAHDPASGHRQQCAAHGEKCRLQNIQRVDFDVVRPADAETQRVAPDDRGSSARALRASTSWNRRRPRWACRGRKITAAATTGPARGPRPASSMPATAPHVAGSVRAWRGTHQGEDGLRRARAGAAPQLRVNPRELPLQGAAPLGIVKPHQELRSDRLRDNLLLKILADDAPIRK